LPENILQLVLISNDTDENIKYKSYEVACFSGNFLFTKEVYNYFFFTVHIFPKYFLYSTGFFTFLMASTVLIYSSKYKQNDLHKIWNCIKKHQF